MGLETKKRLGPIDNPIIKIKFRIAFAIYFCLEPTDKHQPNYRQIKENAAVVKLGFTCVSTT